MEANALLAALIRSRQQLVHLGCWYVQIGRNAKLDEENPRHEKWVGEMEVPAGLMALAELEE